LPTAPRVDAIIDKRFVLFSLQTTMNYVKVRSIARQDIGIGPVASMDGAFQARRPLVAQQAL
jgi:hypothetical protein